MIIIMSADTGMFIVSELKIWISGEPAWLLGKMVRGTYWLEIINARFGLLPYLFGSGGVGVYNLVPCNKKGL